MSSTDIVVRDGDAVAGEVIDLTPEQIAEFEERDAIVVREVEHIRQAGWKLAEQLLAIRSKRLYLRTHPTFEAYCQERLGFGSSRARQLTDAYQHVIENGLVTDNENQVRPLLALARSHTEVYMRTLADAHERWPGQVTPGLLLNALDNELRHQRRASERIQRLRERQEHNDQIAENLSRQVNLLAMPERPISPGDAAFAGLDRPAKRGTETASLTLAVSGVRWPIP